MRNREEEDRIGTEIVDAAYHVHKELGPGLLEKVYEACMEYELVRRGFNVKRQIILPIEYNGIVFNEALKLDLLINDSVIIELKSIELHNKLWEAQILSHLKLTQLNLGYLINFGTPLIKQGIKRYKINI